MIKDNIFNKWWWENWATNCKAETIKLLKENIWEILSDINHSKILYDLPPRVMEITINK